MKLANNLDFSKYEAQNMRLQSLAVAPTGVAGQVYFDTALAKPQIHNGTSWGTFGAQSATDLSDVTVTSPATGQVLRWSGTEFVNAAIAQADVTGLVAALAGKTDNTILISAGTGLAGGGQLNQSRTIAVDFTTSGVVSTTKAVRADDSRLSDARTPLAHTHAAADLASGVVDVARLGTTPAAATFLKAGAATGSAAWTALTKSDVGLANVDNTSDANKPVSTATQTALNGKANTSHTHTIADVANLQTSLDAKLDDSQLGAANGVASLDAGGKLPTSQLPNLSLTDVSVVADYTARNALTVQEGDVAIVTGTSETFIYDGTAWQLIRSPADGVTSITAGTGITSTGGASPTIAVDTAVVARKVAANIGDGTATSFVVTHNLGTRDVIGQVYNNAAPYDVVIADIENTSTTTCTVRFGSAPALNAYRVVIHG
jgi:hypothetical protein